MNSLGRDVPLAQCQWSSGDRSETLESAAVLTPSQKRTTRRRVHLGPQISATIRCAAIATVALVLATVAPSASAQLATKNWKVLNRAGDEFDRAYTPLQACERWIELANQSIGMCVNDGSKSAKWLSTYLSGTGPNAYYCGGYHACSPEGQDTFGTVEKACPTSITLPDPTNTYCAPIRYGATSVPKSCPRVGKPIYPLTGRMTHPIDIGIAIGGIKLVLEYDTSRSFTAAAGDAVYADPQVDSSSFGPLWFSSFHRSLLVVNGVPKTAFRGDSTVVNFTTATGGYGSTDPEVTDTITAGGGSFFYKDNKAKTVETYNSVGQLTGLTDGRGNTLSFTYSTSSTPSSSAPAPGYLLQVADAQGRSISFTYVLPSGGVAATDGLINTVTDAAGRVTNAAYDSQKNLTSLTWADGKAIQFLYENSQLPWALTGLLDEKNVRQMSWTYDGLGRATESSLAGGVESHHVTYSATPSVVLNCGYTWIAAGQYWLYACSQPATPSTWTDPNGNAIDITPVQVGNFSRASTMSQPAGSGCGPTSSASTYDVSGNVLSREDFAGNRACFAYDSNNQEIARVEGLLNTASCASALDGTVLLPNNAKKTLTNWSPDWKLPSRVVAPGSVTTTVFNGKQDPFTGSVANCSPLAAMPNGVAAPLVCKQVVQSALNLAQSSWLTNDPLAGSVNVYLRGEGVIGAADFTDSSPTPKTVTAEQNCPSGNDVTTSNVQVANGGASIYFGKCAGGDARGNLSVQGVSGFWQSDWTVDFFALPSDANQANAALFGNRQSGGAALTAVYAGSRLSALYMTAYSGGQSGGNWSYLALADTNSQGFSSARSPVGVFDHIALTKVGRTYTVFINGVKMAPVVAGFDIDGSADSTMKIGAACGLSCSYRYEFSGYIDDFRITAGERYTANFVPPGVVSLDSAVPASVILFSYDSAGRKLTTTDPNGKVTTYSYYASTSFSGADPDAIGHFQGDLQSVTNPAGHVTQYTLYDKAGRVRQMVDPKGITTDISYTPRGWVSSTVVTPSGGSARTTSYSYDFAGQLTGVSNPDGTSLAYSYDAAHRLTGITDARGNSVTYTLDNAGNRTSEQVKDPGGTLQRAISRSFDALNRVQQITGAIN